MRGFLVAVTLLLMAGCGDIQWFPNSTATSTTGGTSGNAAAPNAFTVSTTKTISATQATLDKTIDFDPITIAGNNTNGWTLTMVDNKVATMSSLIIARPSLGLPLHYDRTTDGTIGGPIIVYPGDVITVSQVPSETANDFVSTIVTIGTYTKEFRTTTTP